VELEFSADITVQYTVRGSQTTSPGSCVCGSIDRSDVYANTPSWLDNLGWSFDSNVEVDCDAC
jgi:hypothetical protein